MINNKFYCHSYEVVDSFGNKVDEYIGTQFDKNNYGIVSNSSLKKILCFLQNKIISDYRLESLISVSQEWINDGSEYNNEYFKAERLRLVSNENITINKTINNLDDIWIEIQGTVEEIDKTLKVGIALNDENQNILFESYINNPLDSKHINIKKGLNIFRAKLPLSILQEGKYELQLISGLHNIRWFNNTGNTSPNIVFEITDSLMKSSNLIEQRGLLNLNIEWSNHSE